MPPSSDPKALLRRAVSLHEAGHLAKALALYRQLVAQFPGSDQLLFLLGSAEAQNGNAAEGVRLLERCLLVNPLNPNACNNLGLALEALTRPDDALQAYDRAIALQPDIAEAHVNKGLVLRKLGRLPEALASFERALDADAGNPEQHSNRGNVLADLGRSDEALASFNRAIELKPDYAEAFANRGSALHGAGRPAEALASFDRALALNPALAEAHNLRGDLLLAMRREVEARDSFRRAHALKPDLEFVYPRWLYARLRTCDWTGIAPQLAKLEARILAGRQLCVPFDSLGLTGSLAVQSAAARSYAKARFVSRKDPGRMPAPPAGGRTRLGYFSSDYRDHATTRLIAELFELHDRQRFELTGFDWGPRTEDPMRTRVVAGFDRFVDVRTMSDHEVARVSRELQIDIAIDLKGYTEDARPGIFAERAAPVQASYLGFPGTMGVDWIDYIIADAVVIPEASRSFYAEKVVYLPGSYQVNDRTRAVSARRFSREELELPPTGVVFCCFNNNYKITLPTFDAWMRILKRVDGAVLWLIEDSATAAANLRAEAGKRGVRADRLVFARRMPLPDHLARSRAADLFLDTLPYNAHTTASDALWAGVPVLTCVGEAFASRVAASLLTALDLPELITHDAAGFETAAVSLANDAARLMQLRERLAANRLHAALFDTPRFARQLECAYERMHERRLKGLSPDHLHIAPM